MSKSILKEYKIKRSHIQKRLKEFKKLRKAKEEDLFRELCFCILTPQSKAIYCDKAINLLETRDLLHRGSAKTISANLKGLVRFHNNKASYLVAARKLFKNGNIIKTREWLVKNVKGLGYKEASHFLRNIGSGRDICILDRHILLNLKKHKVIEKIPPAISKRKYLELEEKMRGFARRLKISLQELDLLFWSRQTGFIFK